MAHPKMRAVTAGPAGTSDCSLAFHLQVTQFLQNAQSQKVSRKETEVATVEFLAPSPAPSLLTFHPSPCPSPRALPAPTPQAPPGPGLGGALVLGEGCSRKSQSPSPTSRIQESSSGPTGWLLILF